MAEMDGEHERPAATGNGFLWKTNAYWLIEQRTEGVYLECRSISLSRGIPAGLGWVIRPCVSGMPTLLIADTRERAVERTPNQFAARHTMAASSARGWRLAHQ